MLLAPLRGSNVGVWDVPVNADWTALDGILGGNATISLSAATTLALSVPATGSVTPGAGPNQSQNNIIVFSGTLTGNCIIQLTLPRSYAFDNQCTVGTSYIQIAPSSGTGTAVGLPPGEVSQVIYDGTNIKIVGLGRVGSYLDLAVSTTPPWMNAFSKAPFLITDGSTYSTNIYPALGAMLGSTFGGNGITTFGTPDLRSRARISIDTNGPGSFSGRITAAISGINGTTLGAAGGSESLQAHLHQNTASGTVNITNVLLTNGLLDISVGAGGKLDPTTATTNPSVAVTMTNATTGAGNSQNVQPTFVSGLTFIKT